MTSIQTEAFGLSAILSMLLCYALEDVDPRFVLGFAFACLASAAYAALIGSWPFTIVEVVWSGIAVARWRRIRSPDPDAARPATERSTSTGTSTKTRRAE